MLLIPSLDAEGAAIATLATEAVVLAPALWLLAVRRRGRLDVGSWHGSAWRGPAGWRSRWCSTGWCSSACAGVAVYLLLGLLTGALSRRQLELTRG